MVGNVEQAAAPGNLGLTRMRGIYLAGGIIGRFIASGTKSLNGKSYA